MAEYIEPLATVDEIKLNGVRIRDAIGGQGLEKCSFDADIELATQIEFAYVDPGFQLTRKKVKFTIGDPATFQGYRFQVSRIQVGDQNGNPLVTVSLRSDAIRKLKELQGKKSMQSASPSQFIAAELRQLGLTGVLQPSPKRNTISRDVAKKGEAKKMDPSAADNEMSSWTTLQRLSSETGYLMFENAGVVYFGQPSWLVARDTAPLTVAFGKTFFDAATGKKTQPFDVPTCSASIDSKINEVTVVLEPKWYRQVQPGQALKLKGVPGFDATYLVSSVRYDMMGTTSIEVVARTPINQTPAKGPFADGSRLI